jgi:hypothetical protein
MILNKTSNQHKQNNKQQIFNFIENRYQFSRNNQQSKFRHSKHIHNESKSEESSSSTKDNSTEANTQIWETEDFKIWSVWNSDFQDTPKYSMTKERLSDWQNATKHIVSIRKNESDVSSKFRSQYFLSSRNKIGQPNLQK